MNLELYKIFYCVAECGNITKASEKLCISQPAVTKHIQNLEDYLGTPLFIRTKRGVKLTEAGESIFLKVKEALTLLQEVEVDLTGYNDGSKGTIKLGVSTTLAREYIEYIDAFHKKYPNITFDISTYPTKDLIVKLKNGLIDLILCKLPKNVDKELDYQIINKTEYIFVTTDKNKELLNKKVNIKDLIKYPILLQESNSNSRESADLYFKNLGIDIEPSMEVGSSNLLIEFIKINFGVGYVTKLYVIDELKSKELYEIDVTPKPESIDFGIITLRNNVMSFYVKEFIDIILSKK